jgi:uncharacterized protein (TIGR03118 family)
MSDARRFVKRVRLLSLVGALCSASAVALAVTFQHHTQYVRHDLVADDPSIAADVHDPNLVNPWGIVPNPKGVWWVADNHSGLSTLYDQDGAIQSLVVNIPGANGEPAGGAPTGIVFNGGTGFVVHDDAGDTGPAAFLFASEDGVISGWNPAVPPPPPSHQAQVAVDKSRDGAIFKGLALAHTDAGDRLYATDFHNNRVLVFDGEFTEVTRRDAFVDSRLPDRFAPFGIAAIDGNIVVSFAEQDENAEDDVPGSGRGFVDVFDVDGHLVTRLIQHGHLDAPWGLVRAPDDFGEFSGDLLVGNFGDGRINAYDLKTGQPHGTLSSRPGRPIEIEGLWGLAFGNDGAAGPHNVLFFASGPGGESHGVFGSISAGD